jgi:hypothetical protein
MIIAYEEGGISKERKATADEITSIELAQSEAAEAKKDELAQIAAHSKAKANLLDRLELTAEEAALLLG